MPLDPLPTSKKKSNKNYSKRKKASMPKFTLSYASSPAMSMEEGVVPCFQ
jgi:hypothetical protein